jgi:hypothetical protein
VNGGDRAMKKQFRMRIGRPHAESLGKRAGLALVALALCCALTLTACNWELTVYRVLAVAQTEYDSYWRAVATLHEQGAVPDADYVRAKAIADRIYTLGKNTTALMVSYKKITDPAVKDKINAAIAELPGLTAALLALVTSFGGTAHPQPQLVEGARPYLVHIERDLADVEVLQ